MKKYEVLLIVFLTLCGSGVSLIGKASAQDLTISTDTTWQPGTYTYDNVTITNSATLTFNGAVTLNTQNLTIDSGSSISSDAKGYSPCSGPGAPPPWSGGSCWAAGAGYGGKGGQGRGGIPAGSIYGSSLAPEEMGSGANGRYSGTHGGGAIKLVVQNSLTNNGSITASGENSADYYSGGGSGGSVYIVTNSLDGAGAISANGGRGNDHTAGGGGGGRIAVYYKTSTFTGIAEAKGGLGYGGEGLPPVAAEDGTVVFQPISLDAPITSFNLIEKSSTTATSQETLTIQVITLDNVQITGDLTGTLSFTNTNALNKLTNGVSRATF